MSHSKPRRLAFPPEPTQLLPCHSPAPTRKKSLLAFTPPCLPAPRHRRRSGALCRTTPPAARRRSGSPFPLPVGEQRNHRELSQQRGSSPLERPLGPMPLGFEPQALTDLLKSGLHLPAPHKPGDDLPRVSALRCRCTRREPGCPIPL